ncbi:maleylpyruvate isomerase N-terminal domain-containing protein [Amycolatopsis minnesotensis]|uniref:Mycothiol-dependent maleylpyruvate isomerase metal-binding domain-containing protein n=1 Tax=Amycolatopsis minnesotensis TaxID=337894 RepID=A0ABN2R007_9PSEU
MTDIETGIAGHRRALAAVLEDPDEGQWDTPSLCAGWRVREVVAHSTMPLAPT